MMGMKMKIPLVKLAEKVEELLDEARNIDFENPGDARDKVIQAYCLIKDAPGIWRIEPAWKQARDYYTEQIPEIEGCLIDFGIGLNASDHSPY